MGGASRLAGSLAGGAQADFVLGYKDSAPVALRKSHFVREKNPAFRGWIVAAR